MKVLEKNRLSVAGELKDSVFFGIKKEGFAHIFNVLRNQLYSDKTLAVIREYSANAYDAHVDSGIKDTPFIVTLPTRFDSFFKVRDFGAGLSQQEVRDIYANYGESTKRHSNDYIGQLGLGSKSAFAYADSFIITSYNGGVKFVYNAFIDESDVGKIVLLESGTCDEKDGIEISVPVEHDDIDEFKTKAENLYKYYEVKPIIHGQTIEFEKESKVILEGEGWKIRENGSGAVAVMGNIGYDIDSYALGLSSSSSNEDNYNFSRMSGLELHFDIGDLEMAASREGLQYTDHTKKSIFRRFKNLKKEIIKKVEERFNGCKSHYDAKVLFHSLFDLTSDLQMVRSVIAKDLKFNGDKVDTSQYYFEDEEATVYTVGRTQRSRNYKAVKTNRIEARENAVIIKNDIGNFRGLLSRIVPFSVDDKVPFVYSFVSKEKEKEYIKKNKFDPTKVILLSSLKKHKLSDLAQKYSNIQDSSGGSVGDYVKCSKHGTKTFVLDWDKVEGNSWRTKASDYWKEEKVNLDSDSGIYVIIDRFKVENQDKSGYSTSINPSHMKRYADCFDKLDLDKPVIYGFKKSMESKVEGKKGWKNFNPWLKKTIKSELEKKNFTQEFVDFQAWTAAQKDYHSSPLYNIGDKFYAKLNKVMCNDSIFYKFVKKCKEVSATHKECENYFDLLKEVGIEGNKVSGTVKAYPFEKECKEVLETYAMLGHVDKYQYGYRCEPEFVKHIIHYVNLIDDMKVTVE